MLPSFLSACLTSLSLHSTTHNLCAVLQSTFRPLLTHSWACNNGDAAHLQIQPQHRCLVSQLSLQTSRPGGDTACKRRVNYFPSYISSFLAWERSSRPRARAALQLAIRSAACFALGAASGCSAGHVASRPCNFPRIKRSSYQPSWIVHPHPDQLLPQLLQSFLPAVLFPPASLLPSLFKWQLLRLSS